MVIVAISGPATSRHSAGTCLEIFIGMSKIVMRIGSKAYLSSSDRCLTLHIIRHRPQMKNTKYNYEEIKVKMEYNYIHVIPMPKFSETLPFSPCQVKTYNTKSAENIDIIYDTMNQCSKFEENLMRTS